MSVIPAGWGIAPWATEPVPAVHRDRQRARDATDALVDSGYAFASNSRSQKIRDIRDRFGVCHKVASRALRQAETTKPAEAGLEGQPGRA